jgi:putative NADPH-quinone reductase
VALRLCLGRYCAQGAVDGGHEVQRIDVARTEFPLLRSKNEFEKGLPPEPIAAAQKAILRADHLEFLYPLWLGSMPALLKGFLEQAFRPKLAFVYGTSGAVVKKCLTGKTARIIVTMGMPAIIYRWFSWPTVSKVWNGTFSPFAASGPPRRA